MTDPFSKLEAQLDAGLRLPARVERRMDPVDPFSTLPSQVVGAPQMVTAGRYRLPNRDGSPHKGGWTRATNLASSISDTKALGDWECRMVLLGVREALAQHLPPEEYVLLPEAVRALLTMPIETMEPGKIRSALMELVGQFKALAKAELGAERGNLAHKMVEHHHAGIPTTGIPQETLDKLPSYVSRLPLHKLEALPGMQERQVMVESLNSVGTLDNILRDLLSTAEIRDHIADLKTQKRFWSWLEIACQLALYAHGDAMWDPIGARWVDMPAVNQEVALVAWMPWEHPSGNPEVDIYQVDIRKGWDALQVAHQVYGIRAQAKSKSEPWGWLREVPRQGLLEAYGARLRDCATRAEASAVYAEASAAGVWGPELEQVAAEILPRFS
jgi:hypothetical protein